MGVVALHLLLLLVQYHDHLTANAFHIQPPIFLKPSPSSNYKSRRRLLHQHIPSTHATFSNSHSSKLVLSATESDSSPLDDLLEKFAMPLEFKKGGSGGGDDSSAKDESSSSSSTSTDTVETSADASGSSFTPSPDTPLANKYFLKKAQLADEAKKSEETTTEEKSTETADISAPSPQPKPRRFTDFGIASERAEPVDGGETIQQDSTDATPPPKQLRGFTDFSITRQSRPVKVSVEKAEQSVVPETKPAQPPAAPETKSVQSQPAQETETKAVESAKSPETTTTNEVSSDEADMKVEKAAEAAPVPKEETAPAAVSTTKEESSVAPSPAATQPSQPSPELIQTQPASPSNTLTIPSINLDVESFGLLPLVIIGISLYLALGIYVKQVNENDEGYAGWDDLKKKQDVEEKKPGIIEESKNLLQKVKDAGKAGAISYALWEAAFWGISVPVCLVSYRQVTGHWPDLTSSEDLRKVGLEAFAFVNFARLAVPIRIGLALSTVPWVEENILSKMNSAREEEGDGMIEMESDQVDISSSYANEQYGFDTQQTEELVPEPLPQTSYDGNEEDEDSSAMSQVEERLNRMEAEASRITSTAMKSINTGIDPKLLQEKERKYVPGNKTGNIEDYCEPGQVDEDCTESIQGYLSSLASTGAVATTEETRAIVGYLDSLSSNVAPNENTGAAFVSYLDALSTGYVPAPQSAKAVAGYLDVLSNGSSSQPGLGSGEGMVPAKEQKMGSRINEVEERLSRLESSVTSLPDDIAMRLVDWQVSQDKKLSDEMEKIMQLLVDGKTLEK